MSPDDVLIPLAALLVGIAVTAVVMHRRRNAAEPPPVRAKILFPFVGTELSERALQATLRLAWAEQAVVVPAYLATVPLPLTLDAPVGRAADDAFTVFEAIEQRAAKVGVPVDGRIARGRNVRHALRRLMADVAGLRGWSWTARPSASTTSPGSCATCPARWSSIRPAPRAA